MPNDFCPINPVPYPVRIPNGIYDDDATGYRMEFWDNKLVWKRLKADVDADTVANPPAGPVVGVPAWGTYKKLPDPPVPWIP